MSPDIGESEVSLTGTMWRLRTPVAISNTFIEAKLKTLHFLLISLALMIVLSACNVQIIFNSPTQTPVGTAAAKPLPVNATQTEVATITPTDTPTLIASPVLRTIVPNTPTWSVYNFTCALATGGATMTMNLAWKDRSTSEDGYRVYRDKQIIATLPPNSTTYVDVIFIAAGKTVSYSVEAFAQGWQFSTPTVTNGCQ
jgi:hypothetical protein